MSGGVPLYGYVVVACLLALAVLALLVGRWTGYDRGWSACEEERQQAAARRVHPVYRVRPPQLVPAPVHHEHPADAPHTFSWERISAEVADETWIAHEEQALAIVRDPRTDSQWTADMAADMGAFLARLLNDHPATEEL